MKDRTVEALEALEDVLKNVLDNARSDGVHVGLTLSPEPVALGRKLLAEVKQARERGELPPKK